eukprot:g486.t1
MYRDQIKKLALQAAERAKAQGGKSLAMVNDKVNQKFKTSITIATLVKNYTLCRVPPYIGFIRYHPSVRKFQRTFIGMDMNDRELKGIHTCFVNMDADKSGSISVREFFDFFNYSYVTPMARRFFTTFDVDNSRELDFVEFSVAAWAFLCNNETGVIHFAFDIYDKDRSSSLDYFELRRFFRELYGGFDRMSSITRMQCEDLLERFRDTDNEMSKEEFVEWVSARRGSFFPLFTLQREMKIHILGMRYWNKKVKKLDQLWGKDRGEFMLTLQYIEKQVNLTWQIADVLDGERADQLIENFRNTTFRELFRKRGVKHLIPKKKVVKSKEELNWEKEQEEKRRKQERRKFNQNLKLWKRKHDKYGRLFYYNVETKKVQWEKPDPRPPKWSPDYKSWKARQWKKRREREKYIKRMGGLRKEVKEEKEEKKDRRAKAVATWNSSSSSSSSSSSEEETTPKESKFSRPLSRPMPKRIAKATMRKRVIPQTISEQQNSPSSRIAPQQRPKSSHVRRKKKKVEVKKRPHSRSGKRRVHSRSGKKRVQQQSRRKKKVPA